MVVFLWRCSVVVPPWACGRGSVTVGRGSRPAEARRTPPRCAAANVRSSGGGRRPLLLTQHTDHCGSSWVPFHLLHSQHQGGWPVEAKGDGVLAPRVSSKPHRRTRLCSHIVGEAANLFAVRWGRSRVMTAERNSRDRLLDPSVEVRPFAIPLPVSPTLPPSRHSSVLGNAFAFTLAAAVDARR